MKRLYTLLVVLILTVSYASGQVVTERCWHLDKVQFLQHKQDFWRSHKMFSTTAKDYSAITGGYYNLTELQYGFGLGLVNVPYSHHFGGISTINGYRFGSGLALGVGLGYNKYNDGYTIPVYGDIRYFMGKERIKFFVAVPGGFFLNFENPEDYSRVFGNPSLGLIVPLAKSTHLSFSAGLLTQYTISKPHNRDSFINMRLGILFGK
jgi:hypothetical protein